MLTAQLVTITIFFSYDFADINWICIIIIFLFGKSRDKLDKLHVISKHVEVDRVY